MTHAIISSSITQHGFIGKPGEFGAIGEFRLPANRLQLRRIDTTTVTALIVDLERDFPVSGNWYSPDVHYFDMSFIPRPPASRGCFEEVFSQRQNYGKVFVAPAGYRLSADGSDGLQRSVNVFIGAHPLFPDEPVLGQDIEPLLRDCLRFNSDTVRHILERIAKEVMQPGFGSDVLVEGLGVTLVVEAARMLQCRLESQGRKGGLPKWRVNLIEERIRSNERFPSISELAELCRLSRRQLTRAFRDETGRTVSSFVREITFERAKTLLTNSDRPIKDIATEVGFKSAAAFAGAFRRATGLTPVVFRATRRGSSF